MDYPKDLDDRPRRLDPIEQVFDISKNVGQFNLETREFTPITRNLQLGIDQFVTVEPNKPLNVDALGNIHGTPRFEKAYTGWRPGSDIIGRLDVGNIVRPPIQIDPGPSYIPEPPKMERPPDVLP